MRSLFSGSCVRTATVVVFAVAVIGAAPSAASASEVFQWGGYGGFTEGLVAREPMMIGGLGSVAVKSVDDSNNSAYALAQDGSVWAWGENNFGELGDGTTVPSRYSAVRVALPDPAVAIGEAEANAFAVTASGHVWAWGERDGSTMCFEPTHTEAYYARPVEIPTLSNVVEVQGGEHHALFLLKNGTVETCGSNKSGQLGVAGIQESGGEPVQVPNLTGVVEISAGERTSCARTSNGKLYVWGSDVEGQVGNGQEEAAVSTPYHVPLPGPVTQVSCGGNLESNGSTVAVVNGTEVYAWGDGSNGQLGTGNFQDSAVPMETSLSFAETVTGGVTSYGRAADGHVYAWGSGYEGALGTGVRGNDATPVPVSLTNAAQISSTARNVVVLRR